MRPTQIYNNLPLSNSNIGHYYLPLLCSKLSHIWMGWPKFIYPKDKLIFFSSTSVQYFAVERTIETVMKLKLTAVMHWEKRDRNRKSIKKIAGASIIWYVLCVTNMSKLHLTFSLWQKMINNKGSENDAVDPCNNS